MVVMSSFIAGDDVEVRNWVVKMEEEYAWVDNAADL